MIFNLICSAGACKSWCSAVFLRHRVEGRSVGNEIGEHISARAEIATRVGCKIKYYASDAGSLKLVYCIDKIRNSVALEGRDSYISDIALKYLSISGLLCDNSACNRIGDELIAAFDRDVHRSADIAGYLLKCRLIAYLGYFSTVNCNDLVVFHNSRSLCGGVLDNKCYRNSAVFLV